MLWADKHRPNTLDKVDIHKDLSATLKNMVQSGSDFPHLLFYGPSGAGKKTRILALLRQIYGPGVEKMKLENKTFEVGAKKKELTITAITSPHHIEVNPSDAGVNDRHVISYMVKDIAASAPITASFATIQSAGSSSNNSGNSTTPGTGELAQAGAFKVIIVNEVDNMSRQAQQALRRTMEKYMGTCRMILCATSTSKVIEPVRSRCLLIRVPAPTHEEVCSYQLAYITSHALYMYAGLCSRLVAYVSLVVSISQICDVLQKVATKEGVKLPPKFAERIAVASDRNLRRALLMMEASKVEQYPFKDDQQVRVPDWERFIEDIAKDLINEQSAQKIYDTRGKLYELLANCIPPELIIKQLSSELMKKLDNELKQEVAHWSAFYEHRLKCGSKAIVHLEAFVARFMSIYKKFLINMFS
eukprot:GEZU01023104.1.p1 GENE.GEZU01023104.1~~GEZU01023104.1.p1  ORF type:complete len:442 (-),score=75.48 GEZU01023104.1:121-1368(-)